MLHTKFHNCITDIPFWYRLTRVVLDKGPLNGCVSAYVGSKTLHQQKPPVLNWRYQLM